MPFREPLLSLRDIADAIDAIKAFTLAMDAEKFRAGPRTVAAVERKLQIVSEPGIRLGDQAEVLCPGLPWRDIRGIWRTIVGELPPLESSVSRALENRRS